MKVRIVVVPPGGGEADYNLVFDLPAVPRAGDYITVLREGEAGTEDFIVRRVWWALKYPEAPAAQTRSSEVTGQLQDGEVGVEAEAAIGQWSSDQHREAWETHPKVQRFEATAY